MLLVILFVTLISRCPTKVSLYYYCGMPFFIVFTILPTQISDNFKSLSAMVHGNRCTAQMVSFLAVCIVKAVAVATIVSFLNIPEKNVFF